LGGLSFATLSLDGEAVWFDVIDLHSAGVLRTRQFNPQGIAIFEAPRSDRLRRRVIPPYPKLYRGAIRPELEASSSS
jgi:hypothetical protein